MGVLPVFNKAEGHNYNLEPLIQTLDDSSGNLIQYGDFSCETCVMSHRSLNRQTSDGTSHIDVMDLQELKDLLGQMAHLADREPQHYYI